MALKIPKYTLKFTKLLRPGHGGTSVPTTDGRGTGVLNFGALTTINASRTTTREAKRTHKFKNEVIRRP